MRTLAAIAGMLGFLLVASAAAGAHLVSSVADTAGPTGSALAEQVRVQWERAVSFGLVHLPPALVVLLAFPRARLALASSLAFLTGIVLFSGVQLARLAFEASAMAVRPDLAPTPGPLDGVGWLVPLGGIALHLGWLLLVAAALWSKPRMHAA